MSITPTQTADFSNSLIPGLSEDLSFSILRDFSPIEVQQYLESRGSKTWWRKKAEIQSSLMSQQKKLSSKELITYQKIFSFRPYVELVLKPWSQIAEENSITFASLETLDLYNDVSLSDADLVEIIKLSPNLTHLNLGRAFDKPKRILSSEIIEALANCPKLAKLNLSGSEGLTVEKICILGQHCPNITVINLSEARGMTDPVINEIATQFPNLIAINLHSINHISWYQWGMISDEGLKAFTEKCTKLECISLNGRDNLSDATLRAFAKNSPELVYCDMSHCKSLSITENGVDQIYSQCTKLQLLALSSSTQAWLDMCYNNRMEKYYQHLNYRAYNQERYGC